ASPEETRAAERLLLFDHSDFQTELRSANGCHVPAGTGANHDDVVFVGHQVRGPVNVSKKRGEQSWNRPAFAVSRTAASLRDRVWRRVHAAARDRTAIPSTSLSAARDASSRGAPWQAR